MAQNTISDHKSLMFRNFVCKSSLHHHFCSVRMSLMGWGRIEWDWHMGMSYLRSLYPQLWRMNHWCVNQILHLVPSQSHWFCSILLSPNRQNMGPIHYITLKAFAMTLWDGTNCKTCFCCYSMVLCGPKKIYPPPPPPCFDRIFLIPFPSPNKSFSWISFLFFPMVFFFQMTP